MILLIEGINIKCDIDVEQRRVGHKILILHGIRSVSPIRGSARPPNITAAAVLHIHF